MNKNKMIDRFWVLIDEGYTRQNAIAIVCAEFQLSSYQEDQFLKTLP